VICRDLRAGQAARGIDLVADRGEHAVEGSGELRVLVADQVIEPAALRASVCGLRGRFLEWKLARLERLIAMAVSIKDPDTDHLIRELARRTGETQVAAVKTAVMERLARLDHDQDRRRRSRRDRLAAIARDTAPRLSGITASMDIGSYLYDDRGLPG
jgi:hypothetical protein